MNTVYPILLFILCVTVGMNAQTKIGGKVVDQDGAPLAFANVIFINSTEGTITNENGRFYLESENDHDAVEFSFTGYKNVTLPLRKGNNLDLEITLEDSSEALSTVVIYKGKTSKKNNPAIDILRKIWKNKRQNGLQQHPQYQYDKYEKLEFDLNSIDSSMINSRTFKDIKFIFEKIDTNSLSGKNYLPIFINEAVSSVYGDNRINKEKEILRGNNNSGFSDNHALTDFIKDLYADYDVYNNYLKFFNKSFVSPLSKTGIDVYNYILADSAYLNDKWSYKIVYYPRRKNELTFKGDFWVNDTTFAIQRINLEMTKSANINWVNDVYIEQEFETIDDSTFVLTRDHFVTNFALHKDDKAKGLYGQRTTSYDNFEFDKEQPKDFYSKKRQRFDKNVYHRSPEFWQKERMDNLTEQERGIYDMLDTLRKTRTFKNFYKLGGIISSGYVNFDFFDFGPLPALVGYNEVEGFRTRVGGRTFFTPDDMWRLEGYIAYGAKDHQFKYGISGKWLIDPISRLKIIAGHRRDIEQLGAQLTNSSDILGRSMATSSIFTIGSNKTLSSINLTSLGFEVSPVENFKIGIEGSYRTLKSASSEFDLNYYTNPERTQTAADVKQSELTAKVELTPNRRVTNHGVERIVVNKRHYGQLLLKYSKGIKGVLDSDFNYDRVELYYNQPLYIGGFGRLTTVLEAGKTFGTVPLSLLNPVPGNQTIFTIEGTYPLLDYYEFVTDTYASIHLEHNFEGRLFSYVPLLRDLNLREIVGIQGVIGSLSEENKALNASTTNPDLIAPKDEPFWSWNVGVGNIMKFFRVDVHFRGNYRSPGVRKVGVTGGVEIDF